VFGFSPEFVFGFTPEWCSESSRNAVRLPSGMLFDFAGMRKGRLAYRGIHPQAPPELENQCMGAPDDTGAAPSRLAR